MISADIQFVTEFFKALEHKGIKYCILRNADEVEAGDAHDIDMTVEFDRMQEAARILDDIARASGWIMHMKTGDINDDVNIKCINYYTKQNNELILIHFDFFPTFTWNGMVLLNNTQMLQNIDDSSIFHKADPCVEAITKLFIRLLYNGYVKDKYKQFVIDAFRNEPIKIVQLMSEFITTSMAQDIYALVIDQLWTDIEEKRKSIINNIIKVQKNKRDYKKNKITYYIYLLKKFIHKSAPFVVFEGTDGSGKTTIIDHLPCVLERTYNENLIHYYHWRPGILKGINSGNNKTTVCTEPHKKKPYGKVKSMFKYLYFNIDFVLGYFLKIRIQLCKGHMVIFDRYYYDYYLDKLRYRLDISDRILNAFLWMIPKPDITVLLMGDAKVIYERKKELPLEEVQRQIDNLQNYKCCFSNPYTVDVDKDINTVVNGVAEAILKKNSEKFL